MDSNQTTPDALLIQKQQQALDKLQAFLKDNKIVLKASAVTFSPNKDGLLVVQPQTIMVDVEPEVEQNNTPLPVNNAIN